jgi:hypothetical protein
MTLPTGFTPTQEAILLGCILGDSHIQKTSAASGKCRFRVSHTFKHKDYVDWKYKVFKNFCAPNYEGPHIEGRKSPKSAFQAYLLQTSYSHEFARVHAKWYVPEIVTLADGTPKTKFVKRVPADLIKTFTNPLTLAVWYLDDGTKRTDTESCRLATQGFTREENEILVDCLFKNFGIEAKIEETRSRKGEVKYQIAILSRTGGYKKFRELIEPYVPKEAPSMHYKIKKDPKNPVTTNLFRGCLQACSASLSSPKNRRRALII